MDLSIILPSFNEKENVQRIVEAIHACLKHLNLSYEIFFVDDSMDDTPVLLQALAQKDARVRYIHRIEKRGLATAVVEGFQQTQGNNIIVMDADLQHPPSLIPKILEALQEYDVVIPSRFIEGGHSDGLDVFRRFVSWVARKIGQVLIPRLRKVSDCTGGFFGLRRSVIMGVDLDPIGWKILIEILVKGRYEKVLEIPYHFAFRTLGESKMSLKEQWNYLRHIKRLFVYDLKKNKRL